MYVCSFEPLGMEGARYISSACGPERPLGPWMWRSSINNTFHYLPFHIWHVYHLYASKSCDFTLGCDVQPFFHA